MSDTRAEYLARICRGHLIQGLDTFIAQVLKAFHMLKKVFRGPLIVYYAPCAAGYRVHTRTYILPAMGSHRQATHFGR